VTNRRKKNRRLLLLAVGLFVAVGLLEDLSAYERDPKPGPNAPAYVNWRTGEWVDP
jgi:hypothetical protein